MKKIFFIFFLFILGFSFFTLAVKAQTTADPTGLNETANMVGAFQAQQSGTYDSNFLAGQVGKYIGLILSFVGVLFLGLMIYAGISWMTANGNEQTVANAKTMIVNAAIGIVIVLAAYAITSFLGGELLK